MTAVGESEVRLLRLDVIVVAITIKVFAVFLLTLFSLIPRLLSEVPGVVSVSEWALSLRFLVGFCLVSLLDWCFEPFLIRLWLFLIRARGE